MYIVIIFLAVILGGGTVLAGEARDIEDFPVCAYCSMNRKCHAHTRMLIEYSDGTTFAACSIHCAALHLAVHIDRAPAAMRVADYYSRQLIEVESAWWVVGGARPGVMTKRAKWAFQNEKGAEKFISQNGGHMATFDQVMKATYQDLYADTKLIRTIHHQTLFQIASGTEKPTGIREPLPNR